MMSETDTPTRLEIALLPEQARRLTNDAQALGLSLPAYAYWRLTGENAPAATVPVWRRAAAIGEKIPVAARSDVPHDGSMAYEQRIYKIFSQTNANPDKIPELKHSGET